MHSAALVCLCDEAPVLEPTVRRVARKLAEWSCRLDETMVLRGAGADALRHRIVEQQRRHSVVAVYGGDRPSGTVPENGVMWLPLDANDDEMEKQLRICLGSREADDATLVLAGVDAAEAMTIMRTAGVNTRVSQIELPGGEELVLGGDRSAIETLRTLVPPERVLDETRSLEEVVLDEARQSGTRIGGAESCTGGLIGARLTAIPGSSDVVCASLVTYANVAKERVLGVEHALLVEHGAVSEPVVKAMARGVIERLGVDISFAVSGVAGPGGGTPDKPVGTVWIAACAGGCATRLLDLAGDRGRIRRRAATESLVLLRSQMPRVDS